MNREFPPPSTQSHTVESCSHVTKEEMKAIRKILEDDGVLTPSSGSPPSTQSLEDAEVTGQGPQPASYYDQHHDIPPQSDQLFFEVVELTGPAEESSRDQEVVPQPTYLELTALPPDQPSFEDIEFNRPGKQPEDVQSLPDFQYDFQIPAELQQQAEPRTPTLLQTEGRCKYLPTYTYLRFIELVSLTH